MKLKSISILLCALTILSGFSFNEKWARYPRPDETLLIFQDHFPLGFVEFSKLFQSCTLLTQDNRAFLGDNRTTDGKPLVTEPNLHFVKWYTECLSRVVKAEVKQLVVLQQAALTGTLALESLTWIPVPQDLTLKNELVQALQDGAAAKNSSRRPISGDLQAYVLSSALHRMIGPDSILNQKGPLYSSGKLKARLLENINAVDEATLKLMGFENSFAHDSVYGFLAITMIVVGLQDEFLLQ